MKLLPEPLVSWGVVHAVGLTSACGQTGCRSGSHLAACSEALNTPYAWEPLLCFCMPGTGVRTGIWDAWEEEPLKWCHTHLGLLFPLLLSRSSLFVKFSITVQRLKKAKSRGRQHISLEDWQTALCPNRRIFPSCLSLGIGYWVLLGVHFFPYQPSLGGGQH